MILIMYLVCFLFLITAIADYSAALLASTVRPSPALGLVGTDDLVISSRPPCPKLKGMNWSM
jgi:hypothetical protein